MKHIPLREQSARCGTILVLVIVLLLIVVMISGSIVHSLVIDARQLRWDRNGLQAQRLAESGLRRAGVQLAAEPAFQLETWALELPSGRAEVAIHIVTENGSRRIESRATFPTDSASPARATRTLRLPQEVSNGQGGDAPADFPNP